MRRLRILCLQFALRWNGRMVVDWLEDEPVVRRIPGIRIAPNGGSYHDGYPDSFGGPPELRSRGALHVVVVFLPGDQRQANSINTPPTEKAHKLHCSANMSSRMCVFWIYMCGRCRECEGLVCWCVCVCVGYLTSRPSGSGLLQNRFFKAMPELSCGPKQIKSRLGLLCTWQ